MKTPINTRTIRDFKNEVVSLSADKPTPWYLLQSIFVSVPIIEITKETIGKMHEDILILLHYNLGAGYKGNDKPYRKSRAFIRRDKKWVEFDTDDSTFDNLPDIPRAQLEYNPWEESFYKVIFMP